MPGRPELLGTTRGFLDYFNLKRLDELPALSELKDFGDLEPQLRFEGEAMPIGDIASEPDAGSDSADIDSDSGASDASDATRDESAAAESSSQDDTAFTPRIDLQHESNNNTSLESSALAEDGDSDRSNL